MVTSIPADLTGKLEPAELFHEILEHRWYMCEAEGRDVPLIEAVRSYIQNILINRRDEEALIASTTEAISLPDAIPSGTILVSDDDEEGDWRDKV